MKTCPTTENLRELILADIACNISHPKCIIHSKFQHNKEIHKLYYTVFNNTKCEAIYNITDLMRPKIKSYNFIRI